MIDRELIDLYRQAWAVVKPPTRSVTHRQVAETILLPDGPKAGRAYRPQDDPVHDCLMGELDRGWYSITGVGAVQTGKSLALVLVPLVRQLISMRASAVYAQPTGQKLAEAYAGKLHPSLIGAGLGGWLPQSGQGSRGGTTPKFVVFREPETQDRAGMLYLIAGGGKSEAAQAAVTAPLVVVDEVDSFQSRHRVELIGKRADAFGRSATRIYTSTVKSDTTDGEGASMVLSLYNASTASRLWYACPRCNMWQTLEWEQVVYEEGDEGTVEATAAYRCPHCQVKLTDADRMSMLRNWRLAHRGQTVVNGTVQGEAPKTRNFGLLWTALDSTLRDLPTLCVEHYRAECAVRGGDHGPMRSFHRDQLCRAYTGDIDADDGKPLRWQALLTRSQRCTWGPARVSTDREHPGAPHYTFVRRIAPPPPEATYAVAGIDIQHDRVYWVLKGFNGNGTSWYIAWAYEYMRLDHAAGAIGELNSLLDRVDHAIREAADTLPVVLVGVDTGDRADWILPWVKAKGGPYRAIKGSSSTMKVNPGDLEGYVHYRDGVFHIIVDAVRESLQSALRRPNETHGAGILPHGIGVQEATLLRHLCAEQTTIDPKTYKRKVVNMGGRHDWLDASVYADGMMLGFLRDLRDADAAGRLAAMRPPVPSPMGKETDPLAPAPAAKPVQLRSDLAARPPIASGRTWGQTNHEARRSNLTRRWR